jgi:hypothetical protein
MKEAIFNTEIVRSVNGMDGWAYKIPDMPHFAGSLFRFDKEKPFDIVACLFGGEFIAIEGKQMKKYQAFGHRHMRDCQIKALDVIGRLGGAAYVFLNIRQKTPYINRLIVFEWPDPILGTPTKSYKKKELLAMPYVTGKKGLFNLNDIL